MTSKKTAPAPRPDAQWEIVRVASHLKLSYQTARNRMLSGIYGPSEYDPATKTLTVSASAVREAKAAIRAAKSRHKHGRNREKKRAK